MDIAYDHLFWLLSQCFFIAVLLLALFRLRIFFGLGLLYITLGVFQFLQALTASAFSIEIGSDMMVSPGSMVLFTGSLFAVLMIYIREDALEARKVIYGLLAANLSIALLMILFILGANIFEVNNHYNLSEEFFIQNSLVLSLGTIILLLDTFALIFIYEFISKYVPNLFLRILLTMTLVVILDTFLFSIVISEGTESFQINLISGIFSKSLSALVYSGLFTLYLTYFDRRTIISYSKADTYKDIFNKLTFRQKYEDVIEKMKITSHELQETQKTAHLGSYVLDIKTGIWTSSAILNDIFGIDLSYKRDIDGWLQLIHPEDRVMMNDYLSINILTNKENFNKEYQILNKRDDQVIWVHGMGHLKLDNNGNPVKMLGTIQDITKRKRVELELLQSEDRFQRFANASFEGIGIAVKGIIRDANNRLAELTGYSLKELIDNPIMKIIYPDDRKFVGDIIAKGVEDIIEFRLLRKDGNMLWVQVQGRNIVYNGEKARIASLYDISDRKKIKEQLIKSEEKFFKAYSNNPTSLHITSIPDGRFIDVNPTFEKASGFSRKELIGKTVIELGFYVDERDRTKLFDILKKDGRAQDMEIRFKVKNGDIRDCNIYCEMIEIDGEPCLLTIIRDVTEQNKAEKALKKQNEELTILGKKILENNKLLKESETKFKKLFDKNPVSLWEEDYSEVKRLLIKKKAETNDLKKYLNENPDFVTECISKLEILNVNDFSLQLFGVHDKQELISHLGKTFNERSIKVFKKELRAIANNKKEFSAETEFVSSDGKIINALIKFVNISKDNKAIVSIVDITALYRAKEKIKESQAKFKKLFDKNPVSLFEEDFSEVKRMLIKKKAKTNDLKKYLDENLDFVIECISNLEILSVNDVSLELFGFSSEEELLMNVDKIFTANSIENFKKQLIAIVQNKKEFITETEMIRRNGEIINVLIKYVRISDNDRAIVSIVDITELTKAKKEIEKSERQFRELYEKSGDAILIVKKNKFVECNQAAVDMLEYKTKEEFLNSHPSKLSPIFQQDGQKSFDKATDMINAALIKGTHRFEWVHTKRTGKDFPVEVLLTAISNEPNNEVIHCVWRDITDRKKAEMTLKESEGELRKSQEIAQLGTFNLDLVTENFISSEIFDDILGLEDNDPKKFKLYQSLVHPEDFPENQKMLNNCIKTGKIFDREYRIFTKNKNELKWIHAQGEITYNESNPSRFKGNIRDITEKKLNELKLIEVQKIANLGTYEIDLITDEISTSKIFDSILENKDKPKNNNGWWKSITHPEDFERSESLWHDCIKECKVYDDEYRIINKNKEIKWVHDIAETKCEDGIATKIVGTIQDITSRKLSDEKIRRSDTILSQVNSLVQVVDKNGNITYASPSFKNILGFEPEEILGLGWWIKTTPNFKMANKLREEVLDIVINDAPISDELKSRWIKSKDGELKLFDWISSKGENNSLIFIGIDVTDKKEKEEQFKTLTESAQDAIILVDHNGFIFEWNKSSEETFGYTKKEIVGKSVTSLMPKKYSAQYKKGFSAVMKSALKKTYRNNIVEGLTKIGLVFPMELSINYWKSKNKNVYCYFIRDITEREREERVKEIIFNITKKANDTLSLDKFFNFIKTELGKLINTNNFFIALYDEKTDMISTPYMVDELDTDDDFPKGESLTGHVIDTKKAILTKVPFVKTTLEDQKTIGLGPESKCWLGVPLLVDNKCVGAIVVQSYTDENAYSQDDVALLELVASNIGQLIKKTEDIEQINLLNKALIQSPQAVIITNTIGEIEYTNPAFTNLSGYTATEAYGMNPRILNSGEQTSEYYKDLWEIIADGNIWDGEFINKRKDGSKYLVEANISSVKNKDGKITHYIGVQEDITEKRKLERQFINTFIDAQEVEKQNFGEELHDGISQILSAEGMYISLLIEQNQDRINDKAKFLTKIKELNNRAVNETRNIAHGLMSSQLKQSGLLIAVENICIDFNRSKNIVFSFFNKDVKEEELTQEIKTNLFRVVQELTTNLTRYSSATKASVEFGKVNNKVRLIIEDNGIGMDYDKIKKEGNFTGLKNVERRITFLNGTFDVESRPNKGTRWKIIVPLQNIQ